MQVLLTAGIGTVAAVVLLALVVCPFDYGVGESAVLEGGFVLVALYRTVLDDAVWPASNLQLRTS